MRVKTKPGVDPTQFVSIGGVFEVTDEVGNDLIAKGFVERVEDRDGDAKAAQTPQNKMAPDHSNVALSSGNTNRSRDAGNTVSSDAQQSNSPGNYAGDVLAGDQSVNITPPGSPPTQQPTPPRIKR